MSEHELKGTVKIGNDDEVTIDPYTLPLKVSIKDLVEICCRNGVLVTITLQEKDSK